MVAFLGLPISAQDSCFQTEFLPPAGLADSDSYGFGVTTSGAWTFVASPFADVAGDQGRGVVHVYR